MTATVMLGLYRALTGLAQPLIRQHLVSRAKRGKEDPERLGERLGIPSLDRPAGSLVWIHAVSVGESLSGLPLIEALHSRRPDLTLLVTCGTRTAAALLAQRLPKAAIHQYAPVDTPQSAEAFIAHWQPDLAIWLEGELWPNTIFAAKASGAKLALLSARMTKASAKGWQRFSRSARALLGQFDLILAQDSDSQARLTALGASDIGLANLKTLAQPLAYDAAELEALRHQIGDRGVVLGASTHAGEDEIILAAWKGLAKPRPLLILAPRHPERGASLEAMVQSLAIGKTARRSLGQTICASTAVYIADTLGEMGLFYRLARVTLMGGSLLPGIGGHNPLEPARLGSVIISGNQVFNFSKVYADMVTTGGLELVACEAELMKALNLIWHDQTRAEAMAAAALDYCAREAGDLDRLWTSLLPILPSLVQKGDRA